MSAGSKMFRTIVMSAAMLGTPLVARADDAAKAPKVEKTADEMKLAELDAQIAKETDAGKRAALQKQRDALNLRVLAVRQARAAGLVAETQAALAELDKRVASATSAVSAAQNAADRKAANDRLVALKVERVSQAQVLMQRRLDLDAVTKELAAAQPPARPRSTDDDGIPPQRPKGRGFVLS